MGQNKYQAMEKMIDLIKEDEIGLESLKSYIKRFIGFDEKRTIIPTLNALAEFGFIKEIAPFRYKIIKKQLEL